MGHSPAGGFPAIVQDRRLRWRGNPKAARANAGESLHHECVCTFAGGRDGNYLFELEAQPGGPEGRSLTTAGSRPIDIVERPRSVPDLPVLHGCCGSGWNGVVISSRRHFVPNPVEIDSTQFVTLRRSFFIHTRYDAFNRMVSETNTAGDTTTQTRFAFDANQIVMQFSGTGSSALTASNLTDRYLWGPAVDQLMADEQLSSLSSAGNVLYALTDNQNTVRDLATYDSDTDTTTVVDHRVFSTYGKMISEINPSTLEPAAVDCIFGYTGKYADSATGLQWNLNRWYNPSLQTWMSQDPIGFNAGDANLYRYVGNGPTDGIDPTGLADAPPGPGNGGVAKSPRYYPVPGRRYGIHGTLANGSEINAAERANEILDEMRKSLNSNPGRLTGSELATANAELESLISIAIETQPRLGERLGDCYKYQGDLLNRIKNLGQLKYFSRSKIQYPTWNYVAGGISDYWCLGHAAVRIELPNAKVYYFDDGWWNHVFEDTDIPYGWVKPNN